jgi:hypothetical protein
MRKRRLSKCLIALAVLCGCQHDISGTYIVSDSGSVVWLQLVRTPDNHLTGQLAVSVLKPDGTVDQKSAPITGAVDGENVSLTATGLFGLQATALSGTLNGDTLTLTGSQAQPFVLKRSSLTVYQAQMNELNSRAQTILAAKASAGAAQRTERAQRGFVDAVDHLVAHMQRIDSASDVRLGRFPAVEKRYQAITAKINAYVERERRLSGNPNASVDRSGLYVDANQAALDTNLLHLDVQSVQQDFETNAKPVADDAASFENGCRNFDAEHDGLTPTETEAHNAACSRLFEALPVFRQRYDALRAGLAHLEQVYTQENNAQQALLQTAEKLE